LNRGDQGSSPFEQALLGRVDDMLGACTRCGACFAACPITAAAGIADADPEAVVGGVLDIVRSGDGPHASKTWASSCIMSGECIPRCNYGVNPRFLLTVARVAVAKAAHAPGERRRQGVAAFRKLGRDVSVLSQLQLSDAVLERLGQKPSTRSEERPDVVFYTGCNVLKTPHIALLCLDVLDALGVSYRVMGGPTHCCGVQQLRAGDTQTSGRVSANSMDKLAQSSTGTVLSWCPSCYVQFTEVMLPTFERAGRARPFAMTPFFLFLSDNIDRLRPLLRHRVAMRVALHVHPGVAGVADAVNELLRAVPGVELVDLGLPAVGLQSVNLSALPAYKRRLQLEELQAAAARGVDALAAIYHSDHRELCAHERDWPFAIVNVLEIIAASMGLAQQDHYKRLKMLQDADAILSECRDLLAQHGIDEAAAREVIASMLADQPLPLTGKTDHLDVRGGGDASLPG
jgi:heterodisulfide reductase subunit D